MPTDLLSNKIELYQVCFFFLFGYNKTILIFQRLCESLQKRMLRYRLIRDSICWRTKIKFISVLMTRNFEGKMMINHKDCSLNLNVRKICIFHILSLFFQRCQRKMYYCIIIFKCCQSALYFQRLEGVMIQRQQQYYEFRRFIAMRAKYFFIVLLSNRQYNGKMMFNHPKETLEMSVSHAKILP